MAKIIKRRIRKPGGGTRVACMAKLADGRVKFVRCPGAKRKSRKGRK